MNLLENFYYSKILKFFKAIANNHILNNYKNLIRVHKTHVNSKGLSSGEQTCYVKIIMIELNTVYNVNFYNDSNIDKYPIEMPCFISINTKKNTVNLYTHEYRDSDNFNYMEMLNQFTESYQWLTKKKPKRG